MRALPAFLVAIIACGCSTSPATDALEIRHATVIDPQTGLVTADRCIRITGDTITGIDDCAPTPDVTAVDARGHWVIPGLWDMHVHTVWHADVYPAFFEAFVRFGVVGVRDMGGDLDVLQQARWYLEQPDTIGPYLVAPGPFLDGPEPVNPSLSLALKTREDGVKAVRKIAARGADFVKLYTLLPADAALTATDWQDRRAQFVRERALTVRAIREGALVLAGSDAGDLFVPPGASLHDELRLLVDAGMTEMQALRAATADATRVLGLEGRGTIREGARADMLILRSNPLEDIANTRDIEFVILGGALLAPWRNAGGSAQFGQ